jgi:hypothetical protein
MQIAHSRGEHDDVAGRLEVAQDQLPHGASVIDSSLPRDVVLVTDTPEQTACHTRHGHLARQRRARDSGHVREAKADSEKESGVPHIIIQEAG